MPAEQPPRTPVAPALIFLLILLGLLVLPEVVRRLAIRQLQAWIAAPVTIGDVDLNLLTGRARVSDLVIGGKDKTQPILHLPTLDLRFSRRALVQGAVIIHTATASRLALYLERTGPTQWNVAEILRPRTEGDVGIGEFTIEGFEAHGGEMTVVDRTTTPAVTSVLRNLQLTVGPVALTPEADPASLRLEGTLGESTPIELHGSLTPFARPLRLYVEGKVRDYELSRLSPYAEKYVEHQVRRGRVSNEFRYRYAGGTLTGHNEVVIRHVQVGQALGDKFQRQVGIPLELALALLEDSNGEIRLRVQVEGNLDSPKLRVGAVWKGMRNAVMKALAVQLRLPGQVLTVDGKISGVRIDPVGFMPGSLTPNPKAAARLERLIAFLRDRPKVELELRGQSSRQEARALVRQRRGRGVAKQDLRALAEGRARLIERTLVRRGVAPKRIFVVTGDPRAVTKRGPGRVDFRLLD